MTNKTEPAETKPEFDNVHDLLSHIQRNLHAPKSRYNKFGEYHYRSCEDILDATKKLLPDGAFVSLTDEVHLIGDRFYVKAIASIAYKNKAVQTEAFARETESRPKMDGAQLTGGASSYARKYALNGLFCIDDVKDADADEKPDTKTDKKPDDKDAKAKAWIVNFTEQLIATETHEELVALLDKTSKNRNAIAENAPSLVAGMDKSIKAAEIRIQAEEVMKDAK